jgi:hypothetical protein
MEDRWDTKIEATEEEESNITLTSFSNSLDRVISKQNTNM